MKAQEYYGMRIFIILFLWLMTMLPVCGQSYKYIDITDGLSNQNVYTITKDRKGYMWMLTMSGVDRYDGSKMRCYKPGISFNETGALFMLHRLLTDVHGNVWIVSMREGIMRYNALTDSFETVVRLPRRVMADKRIEEVVYSFVDADNMMWILTGGGLLQWDIEDGRLHKIVTDIDLPVINMVQTGDGEYAVATSDGVHLCRLSAGRLRSVLRIGYADGERVERVNSMAVSISGDRALVGTDGNGLYLFSLHGGTSQRLLPHVSVNSIKRNADGELLIATDRAGIYKCDALMQNMMPFIEADYNSPNDIDSNNIRDIYVDDEGRIWIANNPYGVTVLTNGLPQYRWMRHSAEQQSIANNNVNDIIEDSDGDLWFATGDGVSMYDTKRGVWQSWLDKRHSDGSAACEPKMFLALCEVEPGVVWATGYSNDIYVLRKRTHAVSSLSAGSSNKYMQAAVRSADGNVWIGGYYNLQRINPKTGESACFNISPVTCIVERDSTSLWVSTEDGLYLVDKRSGAKSRVSLPTVGVTYIHALYKGADSLLYIGTSCSGLLVYDYKNNRCRRYHSANSSLITDNIHTIVGDAKGERLVLGTDKGLTQMDTRNRLFRNWTYDQGLLTTYFNPTSGVYTSGGRFVMGSNDGAVAFGIKSWHDRPMRSKMVLSNMRIDYELTHPGAKDSPLTVDIDDTDRLTLAYDRNSFSIDVSSINYDYPSDVVYTWRLVGLHNRWSRLGSDHVIRYSSLPPGNYKLQIRAVSNESKNRILQQREIDICVEPPLWRSPWALALYAVAFVGLLVLIYHLLDMRRQRMEAAARIRLLVDSAHDLRTPLTLIKTPLEDIGTNEHLSDAGQENIDMARRGVDGLLRLTDNFINLERAAAYAGRINRSEHRLDVYMMSLATRFIPYAEAKGVSMTYDIAESDERVWFDREKMDSVMKNLLSNAIKYTPCGGAVHLSLSVGHDAWSVEVADTGIGIPEKERKGVFKLYFRASNAVNSSRTGSGIGLMLVKRLVKMHDGKIVLRSSEGEGTSVRFSIPKHSRALRRAFVVQDVGADACGASERQCEHGQEFQAERAATCGKSSAGPGGGARKRVVVAEDNDELRGYLQRSLSDRYEVRICNNGKQALTIIDEYKPDIVVSDIIMPEMRGDELCRCIKDNIETSHIPVILLTALAAENDVAEGLAARADGYIAKPFSMVVLKAKIDSILLNRALLKAKYSGIDCRYDDSALTELDRKFMADVKRHTLEHIDEQGFNVDSLSRLLNMSRTSFYNKIKALTDQAPGDYMRMVRLGRAAVLLAEGGHTVTEVAEMTGFYDAKYFREVFKRYYNMPPAQYAREHSETRL